jgi:hypothetical protein
LGAWRNLADFHVATEPAQGARDAVEDVESWRNAVSTLQFGNITLRHISHSSQVRLRQTGCFSFFS